jgi:hypothetical protein
MSVWSSGGGMCRVNTFFFNPADFLYKAKDLSAPSYPKESVNRSQVEIKRKICDIRSWEKHLYLDLRRSADKSSAFPICSTTKRIFLGWVKEVRTRKS